MKHSGFAQLLLTLILSLTFSAVAAETPPVPIDTVDVCAGDKLYDTLVVSLTDPADTNVAMALVNSPGTLTWAVVGDKINGYYEYTPAQDTIFQIEYRVQFSETESANYFRKYVVRYDEAPTIEDQFRSFKVCWPGPHYLKVYASDPESRPLSFAILSGPGSIASDGVITYTPDTAGVYTFSVEVSDLCSSDTAMIYDTVVFNSSPVIVLPDSVFSLCAPSEICFDFFFSDRDGDQVWFEQVGGPGSTSVINDSTGRTCFTPANLDSAWYTFYYSYLDNCEGVDKALANPDWMYDSLRVLVIVNEPPVISCPEAQEFFSCVTDTFCFNVEAVDPEMGPVQFNVLSGNAWMDQAGKVCFEGSQSSQFTVVIEAVDECGATDTCSVPVTVNGNRPPYVQTAADFALTLCVPETICFSATADDPDFDLASVTVNLGTWDDATDRVCFVPEGPGVYEIIVTATDSCGISDADTTVVTVSMPDKPMVDLGADFDAPLCGAFEVCVNADIVADTIISYILPQENIYSFDPQTGKICFTPDTAGVYTVIFGVLGECGFEDRDTVNVTVSFPPSPFVNLGVDQNQALCEPEEICVDVQTVAAWKSLTSNFGNYNSETGQFCFWADTAGTYRLIATVVDSCDLTASDTILVTIEMNTLPVIALGYDQHIPLCEPDSICIPFETLIDQESEALQLVSNFGSIDPTGAVCFLADTAGTYEIIVTATDDCGAADSDTIMVTVELAGPSSLDLGDDFTANLCAPEEICIDVAWMADEPVFQLPEFGYFDSRTGKFCFTPAEAGTYTVIFGMTDICQRFLADTVEVTVTLASVPFVTLDDDMNIKQCVPEPICVDVSTIANYVSLTPSLGTYDPSTGQVCFTPSEAGSYLLIVSVVDSCGASVADTCSITVDFGNAPVIASLPDTTMYLCYAQWVCLPLSVTDSDNDIATVTVNRGMVTDDGRVCFVPYTGGVFSIIVTATDSCGNQDVDTCEVTVKTDEDVQIECPTDTTVFTCNLVDTFCFAVPGIPEGATVTVSGINTTWNPETQSVCFWSQCSNQNRIRMTITTACSVYDCDFTVTVLCNAAPVVFLPKDTTVGTCGPTSMCFPVGISDANRNLMTVNVTGGVYNPRTGRVCVDLGYSGTQEVIVTAIDSCGLSATDRMNIMIRPNTPPDVTVDAPDSTYTQCMPTQICLPVTISDIDGQQVTVTYVTPGFTYSSQGSLICFTPDTTGRYCGKIVVTDECGVPDTAGFCVNVETGSYVSIQCPTEGAFEYDLCAPASICIPMVVTGPDFQVTTTYGQWTNNQLCFNADSAGTYNIQVIGASECNADTCFVTVNVRIAPPVSITCPGDTTLFNCAPDTLCLPYSASASVSNMAVIGDAYLGEGTVCVPMPSGSGSKTITLIGTGECGADTCSFTVTYATNRPPSIVLTTPNAVTTCTTADVCVKYTATDPDNNIVSIVAGAGVVGADSICFSGLAIGTHEIIATVTDACGATAKDTVLIRVLPGVSATIICPTVLPVDTICAPDTICVTAPVSPANAIVTISPVGYYNTATGQACIPVSATGTIKVKVIATAPCGNDTCDFDINVVRAEAPTVTVRATMDTLLCLTGPKTIKYPVTITGTRVNVTVSSPATYSNGEVSLTVSQPGTYPITVTATGFCGTASKTTTITVRKDQAPVVTVPATQTFERCPGDTEVICIDGISATDAESTPALSMVCGVGEFTHLGSASGGICFVPDTMGLYAFCFEASDGCNMALDTMYVEIIEKEDCDVCVRLSIESGGCTPVGVNKQVELMIETNTPVGGFDVLLSFDKSVLTFNWVTPGAAIDGWEYFTYRLDDVTCGTSCPSRYLRMVGIADMNNGAAHPPQSALSPNGVFATIEFYVANDQNLGDQFLPIKFYWFDCGDNSFSDPTGVNQYIDIRIFNHEGLYLWDEYDEINFREANRPAGLGAKDQCIQEVPGKPAAQRCIEFYNGGIWVCHPDSLDDRGDVNLNGVAYEIGDAVVFSNYFIYGFSAFTVSIPGQTAATDVNADGLTLTVADLVYLIRVIIGDAVALPRLNPYQGEIAVDAIREDGSVAIVSNAPGEIGGAYLVYRLDEGMTVHNVAPGVGAEGMDLMWRVVDNQLRVLIFDIGQNAVAPGEQELLKIDLSGSGELLRVKSEVVDYQGAPYRIAAGKGTLPTTCTLDQNYPNPFNPTTTIGFSLPQAADWMLEIYNVNGNLVCSFTGAADAGSVSVTWDGTATDGSRVASGVYLYRLEAGEFTDTKKMILLK